MTQKSTNPNAPTHFAKAPEGLRAKMHSGLKTLVVTNRAADARGKGDAKAADRTIRALQTMGHSVEMVALSPTPLPVRLINPARSAVYGELLPLGSDPNEVFALPGGADVEHFVNTARAPDPARPLFVFIGRLNYLPTRDAVGRLIKEIWPAVRAAVPLARLRVIGAQPGRRLRTLIERSGAELAADVPDVRPEMRGATALRGPMQLGA